MDGEFLCFLTEHKYFEKQQTLLEPQLYQPTNSMDTYSAI